MKESYWLLGTTAFSVLFLLVAGFIITYISYNLEEISSQNELQGSNDVEVDTNSDSNDETSENIDESSTGDNIDKSTQENTQQFGGGTFDIIPKSDEYFRVFVTNQTYTGNFYLTIYYDNICNEVSLNQNLGSIWKAWIGEDAYHDVETWFYKSNISYIRLDGQLIAENWTDLTDGKIENPITTSEIGEYISSVEKVFTGTNIDGTSIPFENCHQWRRLNDIATTGSAFSTDSGWTNHPAISEDCDDLGRVYCFEQPDF